MSTIIGNPLILAGGGGLSLNIDYCLTPPTDTSKLWVPLGEKPESVEVSGDSLANAVEVVGTKLATLANDAYCCTGAAVNGKIYRFRKNAVVQVYDPTTDSVALGTTSTPTSILYTPAVTIDEEIYLLGANSSNTDIYKYDPATDTFTDTGTSLARYSSRAAAVVIGGKAYVFGGEGSSVSAHAKIQEYDPATNTVTTKTATLTASLISSAAVAINGKAYIFGGVSGSNRVNYIQEYDPVTDTLTVKGATLPTTLSVAGAGALNGKAYILGGSSPTSTYAMGIYEYDPVTDTIITKDTTLPVGMQVGVSAVVGDTIYLLEGTSGSSNVSIRFYTPKAYLAENRLKLFASVYENETTRVVTNIVNGENEQIKLYMTSAFLGDSEGYAEEVDAYVYNTTTEEWQKLDGTSYVSTLAAEVQSLTADLGAAVETIYNNDLEVIDNV